MKTQITLLLLTAQQLVAGQAPDKHIILNTFGTTPGITQAIDMNGDGTDDLVCVAGSHLFWYAVSDTGAIAEQQQFPVCSFDVIDKIICQDVNSDGYTDIVYNTKYDNETFLLTNPALTGTPWTCAQLPGTCRELIGVFDINSDAQPDIIFENASGTLNYMLASDATFGAPAMIPDVYSSTYYVTTNDFDRDGRMDFAVFFYDQGNKYFHNNGNTTFTVSTISTNEYQSGITSGDTNDDGYADVVFSDGPWIQTATFDTISGTFTYPGTSYYIGGLSGVSAINLDNDTDTDWLIKQISGGDYTLRIVETDGNVSFNESTVIASGLNSSVCAFLDITNDALPDLIQPEEGATAYYPSIAPMLWSDSSQTLDLGKPGITAIDYADVNNDGIMDLILGDRNGALGYINFDAVNDSITLSVKLPSMIGDAKVVMVHNTDLDNDGDTDIIASFEREGYGDVERCYYFLNDGFGAFTGHLIANTAWYQIWLTDANADGFTDLITKHTLSPFNISIRYNTGIADSIFSAPEILSTGTVYRVAVADHDADGDDDIFYTKISSTDIFIIENLNDAEGFAAATIFLDTPCSSDINALFAGDTDNDGDVDLAFSDNSNGYLAIQSDGSFTFTEIGLMPSSFIVGPVSTQVMDVNLDGYIDFILTGATTMAKLSNGLGGYYASPVQLTDGYGIFLNVDGNAHPDIVCSDFSTCYMQFNVVPPPTAFIVSELSEIYIAENGSAVSLTVQSAMLPQMAYSVMITPDARLDAGNGAGVPVDIAFAADSSALLPQLISFILPDDTLPEPIALATITIAQTGFIDMPDEELTVIRSVFLTDNDFHIFVVNDSATLNEGGPSDMVSFSMNVVPETPVTYTITPAPEVYADGGLGAVTTITLPPGFASLDTIISIEMSYPQDLFDVPDHYVPLHVDVASDDPDIGTISADIAQLMLHDNDVSAVLRTGPAAIIYTEGIDSFDISFALTTALHQDVMITAMPNAQFDLGNGPGMPVSLTMPAGVEIPEELHFTGIGTDDHIAEGVHYPKIDFELITTDEIYSDWLLGDVTVTLADPVSSAIASETESIGVYPTYTAGLIHICGPAAEAESRITVINSLGRQVMHTLPDAHGDIHIGHLPEGYYFIQLTSAPASPTFKVYLHR